MHLFSNILEVLDEHNFDSSSQLIIGGDFNVHLNAVTVMNIENIRTLTAIGL